MGKHRAVLKAVIVPMMLCFLQLWPGCSKAQCTIDSVGADCGNTVLFFERQWYDTLSPFALVHVHGNETTALQAAQWLLDSVQQGSFTTWRVQRQRLIHFSLGSGNFQFDPNRIFSTDGIIATLGTAVSDTVLLAVQSVADTFLTHFIIGKKLIVALHNNTDAGALSIHSYRRGGVFSKEASDTYINPRRDADDFFYTTDTAYFTYLKRKNYNVVLQNNDQATDDGSLSVYCGRQHIPYINIEAENGHLDQQKDMLKVLWDLILRLL